MTDKEKVNKLYQEVCEKLDLIQGTAYELLYTLEMELVDPMLVILEATRIVTGIEALPQADKELVVSLGDKVASGELSIEEALKLLPDINLEDISPEVPQWKETGTKKPLLN